MVFSTFIFYIFALALISSAFAVVTVRNTIHSVMFLILAFVNAAGLFVMLNAEFLAMLLIIVYVGAIAVLFLFVVMMLNIDEVKRKIHSAGIYFCLLIAVIMALEIYIIASISDIMSSNFEKIIFVPIDAQITNTHAIGNVLYTDFIYPFQLAGGILFVAMIGAITLTNKENKRFIRKQSISQQVNRKREDAVEVVEVESGKGINI